MNINGYYKDINTAIVSDSLIGKKDIYAPDSIIDAAEIMLYNYYNNLSTLTTSDASGFRESRLYANGVQPTTKYLNQMCPLIKKGPDKGKRKTMINISWDILPILPRFKSKVVGYLLKYDFYPECNATDPMSESNRSEIKSKVALQMYYSEFMKDMAKILQIPEEQQELPFQPKSLQEIEIMSDMGAFKLNQEIAMELFIKRSYSMSDWETLRLQIINDLVDLERTIVRDVLDPVTMRPKLQYADPEWTIIQEGPSPSGNGVTAAGEIKFYSLAEILKKYPKIDDTKLQALLQNQYNCRYPITTIREGRLTADKQLNKIAVFEFEYLTYDKKNYKLTEHSNYTGTKQTKGPGDLSVDEPVWMEGVLLLGSRILLDGGRRKNAPYSYAVEQCRSSYNYFRGGERSLINRCIATMDEIMITIYKMRNANLKAKPKGINIDIAALTNITLGGDKLNAMEVLKILREEGDLLYRGRVAANGAPIAGTGEPVSERVGGIGIYIQELLMYYTSKVNELRELTGLSNIVDSSNPNPETLVGTAKIAQEAADDVLRPLIVIYKINKRHCTENLAMRWQFISNFFPDKIKELANETGQPWAKVFAIGSEMAYYKYGFNFDSEVNPQMIQDTKQSALIALQGGQNQGPMITYQDYFMITKLTDEGNYKLARLYLAQAQERKKQQDAEVQAQNSAENSKTMQLAEAAKAEAAKDMIELETMSELTKIREKAKQEERLLRVEYELKQNLANASPRTSS